MHDHISIDDLLRAGVPVFLREHEGHMHTHIIRTSAFSCTLWHDKDRLSSAVGLTFKHPQVTLLFVCSVPLC